MWIKFPLKAVQGLKIKGERNGGKNVLVVYYQSFT
jgi:hypothetical protein